MKLIVVYNMEKTRFGRWFMEGYPAKFHAFFWMGIMTFTGPREFASELLIKHELIHFYQAKREGWLLWNIRYYWYLATVGYRANPYEVEAYERMHEPLTDAEYLRCGLLSAEVLLDIYKAVDREYPIAVRSNRALNEITVGSARKIDER